MMLTVEAGPPRPGVGARPLRAHYSKVSPPIPPRLAGTGSKADLLYPISPPEPAAQGYEYDGEIKASVP